MIHSFFLTGNSLLENDLNLLEALISSIYDPIKQSPL